MGVLKAKVDGAWVEVGGSAAPDVLWVGPDAPTDPTIELWADTDAVSPPSPYTPLDQSGWAWVNQGTATVVQGNGVVYLEGPGSATFNVRARVTSTPALPYTITAHCVMDFIAMNQNFAGLVWRESSTGKLRIFIPDSTNVIGDHNCTNATTYASIVTSRAMAQYAGMRISLRLQDTGTTLVTSYSWSGVEGTFRTVGSVGRTAHMASGPNEVGICIGANTNAGSGPHALTVLSWKVSSP